MADQDAENDPIQHTNGHLDEAIDEQTPLLSNGKPSSSTASASSATLAPSQTDDNTASPPVYSPAQQDEDVPIPKLQIFLLCYARLVEPIAFFSIFPFVPQMIHDIGGVPSDRVGYFAGLIESLFSITQMLLMISWGRASDRFGRRPTLIVSLWGVATATALFGFSKTLWQMVLFRCCAGLFAGTVVTVRTMLSENSTKATQARVFSWFAFASNLGIFVGPLVGGALAKPAEGWPGLFGGVKFFENYPYALPTMVTGGFGASAALFVTLFVKETLQPKQAGEEHVQPMSMAQILKADGVAVVLSIYGMVMLMGLAFTAVLPVYWFEPVELGGYGFEPFYNSLFFAMGGLAQTVWILFAYPPATKRFGTGGVLRFCTYLWPLCYIIVPLGNLLLRKGQRVLFWIIAPLNQVVGSGVAMAFTGAQLALNSVSPGQREFGTLNAMALALNSAVRAFVPIAFSSFYAKSVEEQWLGGQLIFVIMLIISLILFVAMRQLPEKASMEGKVESKPQDSEE